jgi:hypothetical protein
VGTEWSPARIVTAQYQVKDAEEAVKFRKKAIADINKVIKEYL